MTDTEREMWSILREARYLTVEMIARQLGYPLTAEAKKIIQRYRLKILEELYWKHERKRRDSSDELRDVPPADVERAPRADEA